MKHPERTRSEGSARCPAFVTGLGWFLLYFSVLLILLHTVGTDPNLYYRLQMRASILPEAGITEAELIICDDALADYLRGDPAALEGSMFSADEIEHMRDCYGLFILLRCCMYAAAAAGIILICIGMIVLRYRGPGACMVSALCLICPLVIAAVWALIDFYGLFTVFHKLLFTNELWLMDPKTELMIRICPESMFETMAVIIGIGTFAFVFIVNLIHRIVFHKDRRLNNAGL